MVLGSWKENLLVSLELDKIYSMQFFATMSTKFPGICSLRQVRGKCVVFVCPVIFLPLLYEKDVISDIMVMSSVTVKQVWLLYLSDVLCSYQGMEVMLGCAGIEW